MLPQITVSFKRHPIHMLNLRKDKKQIRLSLYWGNKVQGLLLHFVGAFVQRNAGERSSIIDSSIYVNAV